MKRILLSLLLVVSAVGLSAAQTDYYPNESGTIAKDGYTFKYRTLHGLSLEIYNVDQKYYFSEEAYSDGSKKGFDFLYEDDFNPHTGANLSKLDAYETIKDFFSQEQLAYLRTETRYNLFINMTIEPSTGRIADVFFSFPLDAKYKTISPEVFRQIEQFLKENMSFTMTDQGRKLVYAFKLFDINFYDYTPQGSF